MATKEELGRIRANVAAWGDDGGARTQAYVRDCALLLAACDSFAQALEEAEKEIVELNKARAALLEEKMMGKPRVRE